MTMTPTELHAKLAALAELMVDPEFLRGRGLIATSEVIAMIPTILQSLAELGALREALTENIALRCLLGGGCDANDDGPHQTIVHRGKDQFCNDCGDTTVKGKSKPWMTEERLERAVSRFARQALGDAA